MGRSGRVNYMVCGSVFFAEDCTPLVRFCKAVVAAEDCVVKHLRHEGKGRTGRAHRSSAFKWA
jgi:hypothetical protein